jgi:arginine decarboxylase
LKGQEKSPLWEALIAHVTAGYIGFHVPGHKGRYIPQELSAAWGQDVFNYDLTELPGLDNLHAPVGAIKKAQELAAELYGARCTFFLVGGTSAGLIASLLAATKPGDKVLLPRHAHRSLLAATILGGLKPVFYPAVVDPVWGVVCGWDQAEALRIINQHTDARALVLVHPTYHGLVGPAAELIQAAHQAGLTVIADEAHGAHFYFHPDFPPGALRLGADAVVQSPHKLLGSLTQSSWLHLGSDRISPARVAEALRWVESSSPSYLLMASLDLARCQAAQRGREDWDRARQVAQEFTSHMLTIPHVSVLAQLPPAAVDRDPCKVTINISDLGLTGPKAACYLQYQHKIQVELVDFYTLLFIITPADDKCSTERAVQAVTDLAKQQPKTSSGPRALPPLPRVQEMAMLPRAAAYAGHRMVPVMQAVGKIAAQAVVPYPPGVALIWPGEEFTAEIVDILLSFIRLGITVQGPIIDGDQELNVAIVEE